jgi:hypothetical protein
MSQPAGPLVSVALISSLGTALVASFGGNAGQGNYFNNVQYAPLASNGGIGPWTFESHPFPVPRWGQAMVQYNDFIYILGGAQIGNGGYLNDVQVASVRHN